MKLRVEKYSHDEHYARLCQWLAARAIPKPDPSFLSDIGFCIDGIAIGFLFTTNSKICEIDNVAACPKADPEQRDAALLLLFKLLEKEGEARNFGLIKGLAELPTMRSRFLDRGFRRYSEMVLFYKRIDGGSKCLG